MLKNLAFLFLVLGLCGCFPSKKAVVPAAVRAPVISGGEVDSTAFSKGGALFLGSFRAGVNASANEETDALSAEIMKGIKDALPNDNTHFTLQSNAMANSDFFLEGHIDDYICKGRLCRLSIDGEIWFRETGERVFLFQYSGTIDRKTQDPKAAAYQIGEAIARFIGSH